MNISGNTILITGGGSGIGHALAVALQAEGNRVIIAGRRASTLDAAAAATPGLETAVLDIADAAAIAPFAAAITARFPDLNVVINNAGIMIAEDLTAEPVDLTDAEATIATNLLGPIRLIAALLPHLKAQPAATIMTVSSGLAFVPLTATPTYSATKAAIHSYSQSLRQQLRATTVDVIEIAPPAVATDLMPGHAANPHSMPLDAYIAETIANLKAQPHGPENLVERVGFLRHAERDGSYAAVFARLNGG
ncbi:SDR family NAD(P)-dependent oxidoreductase [Sphingomonas sp. RB3P16]|uniref:SDR family oxidoreductase n=1 Tax=Parasphingomonas frigoris TaxID=3096163 RepID=UPI002FC65CD6